MSQFSHLHVHTQFSLLDGAASIQSLYKKAIEDNMPALAITDHGNMFGAFEFVKEAYKHRNEDQSLKVKPIVGCEFYITTDRTRKTFSKDEKDPRHHQILLAKNDLGYKNLVKLTSLGYIEGMYSKYPRIDKELIHKYHEGLIATTCCLGALVPQTILKKGEAEGENEFKQYLMNLIEGDRGAYCIDAAAIATEIQYPKAANVALLGAASPFLPISPEHLMGALMQNLKTEFRAANALAFEAGRHVMQDLIAARKSISA